MKSTTLLIIGLGNPGAQYKNTRHNVGREIAEEFQKMAKSPGFEFEKKWNTEIAEEKNAKQKVVILLPDTMMNKSGSAVAPAMRFYKVKPKDIFLIHDDADIPLGHAKLSFGKHSAGHKGVESVMRALKTREFWRFRIGIAGKRDIPAEKLVLKKFTPKETRTIKKIARRTVEAITATLTTTPDRAMNSYNQ